MTPHGRVHCNDLKVRAPSSRAADPTMSGPRLARDLREGRDDAPGVGASLRRH